MATNIGEPVRIRFKFQQAGVPFNPASVTATIKQPDGTGSTVGPGAPIINDATGSFYFDLTTSQIGSTVVVGIGVDGLGHQVFIPEVIEVVDPTGDMPRVLTSRELDSAIGAVKVDQLFDDDADGIRDPVTVAMLLRRAEDHALSFMLNAWAPDACLVVMQKDAILRMHMAFVAAEFACERKPEFLADDGKGRYWIQFTRAEAYFNQISKSQLASTAEAVAGANGQSGGSVSTSQLPSGSPTFCFAPDRGSPSGHGGFGLLLFIGFELVIRALAHLS